MTLDIAAIKARADKATAGPWELSPHSIGKGGWISGEHGSYTDIVINAGTDRALTNADFIAHARTDIPALIAALEAAVRERDACAGLASQAVSDMATAQNRITALEAALSYYAKEHKNPSEGPWGLTSTDFGNVARRALEAKP